MCINQTIQFTILTHLSRFHLLSFTSSHKKIVRLLSRDRDSNFIFTSLPHLSYQANRNLSLTPNKYDQIKVFNLAPSPQFL